MLIQFHHPVNVFLEPVDDAPHGPDRRRDAVGATSRRIN
jgi:hypothetical protein